MGFVKPFCDKQPAALFNGGHSVIGGKIMDDDVPIFPWINDNHPERVTNLKE